MSVRGNQFKTNTFRDKGAESAPGRSSSGRQPKEKRDFLPSFDLADGRAVKIAGLFFVILSLYFLIAFTSYLFTWQDDQSYARRQAPHAHRRFSITTSFDAVLGAR